MIIQALCDYYNILLNDDDIEIARTGYSVAKVKFSIVLSKEGELLDIKFLRDEDKDWKELMVPEQKKRSVNIFPYFMCDNSKYVLGWDFDTKKNYATEQNFLAFKKLHQEILKNVNNAKSIALLKYLEEWNPEECQINAIIKNRMDILSKSKGGSIVFQLDCDPGYLHQDRDILKAWENYISKVYENEYVTQCLVTGKKEPIEKTHPNIKGVKDANTSGATLVGINAKAFESYGKEQAFNSPVGKTASFAYTTVLNYLLNSKKHRIQMGDATTVFWAEDTSGDCENLLYELIDPVDSEKEEGARNDAKTTEFVKHSLQRLKDGKPIVEKADVNFYILGLSPNNARLSVRFWHKDNFGKLVEKIWQHYGDIKIIKNESKRKLVSLSRILYETIPKNAQKKASSPLLSGALMKSVFTGSQYPKGLYYAIVNRIRADGDINDIRVGVIKAILKRNFRINNNLEKEEMITVSLNEKNPNVSYRLGRLFAVLEKAQKDAADGKLNSTIKDRYFGTASASPRSVFPVLMKLAQHHLSKSKYGTISDKKIEEILQGVEDFPAHLNGEEQGLFILGYYHQRESFFQKNDKNLEGELNNE